MRVGSQLLLRHCACFDGTQVAGRANSSEAERISAESTGQWAETLVRAGGDIGGGRRLESALYCGSAIPDGDWER